jgi:cytochrome c oxidase subunit 3
METLQEQRRRAAKPLLWIGIGSIIMAFAGLTSGYVVSRTTLVMNEQWMTFRPA